MTAFHRYRPRGTPKRAPTGGRPISDTGTPREVLQRCFRQLVVGSLLLTIALYLWWRWREKPESTAFALEEATSVAANMRIHGSLTLSFLIGATALHLWTWFRSGRARERPDEVGAVAIGGLAAGLLGLTLALTFLVQSPTPGREALYATFALPASLLNILVSSQVFTALTSRTSGNEEREWGARFNAWLLMMIVGWAAAFALVLFGPSLVTETWQRVALASAAGGSGIIGLVLSRGADRTGSDVRSQLIRLAQRKGVALVAPIFVLSIIIGLSAINEQLLRATCNLTAVSQLLDCQLPPVPDADLVAEQQTYDIAHAALDTVRADRARLKALSAHLAQQVPNVRYVLTAGELYESPGALMVSLLDSLKGIDHAIDTAVAVRLTTISRLDARSDSLIVAGISHEERYRTLFLDRSDAEVHAIASLDSIRSGSSDLATELADWLKGATDTTAHNALLLRAAARANERATETTSLRAERGVRDAKGLLAESRTRVIAAARDTYFVPRGGAVIGSVLIVFGALLVAAGLLGLAIDTNAFSLRAMYEMRIVRAYLGASRPAADRRANAFTGFDAGDDLPMGALWPAANPTPVGAGGRPATSPPMHVVNTTLNLVAGSNLAWQQRKAESMTISPLYAGSAFLGYRPTSSTTAGPVDAAGVTTRQAVWQSLRQPVRAVMAMRRRARRGKLYGGARGITLGAAVTISGAAASPNAGSHSSPMITFLMTFFNARLGAWLGNPGRAGAASFDQAAPQQKIIPILNEMFGQTTDQSAYVYLSDGGHFENLGLYEMVLRRCRFILVSDAGCDPDASFVDLGNAVRKIRVDLGVPIEFPDGINIYSREEGPHVNGTYWTVGRVKYSAIDDGPDKALVDGVIVYIKPAIYFTEPRDVQQYAESSETFPHESTSDQFFSESQFESYRALGEYIVRRMIEHPLGDSTVDVRHSREDTLLAHWRDLFAASAMAAGMRQPPRHSGEVAAVTASPRPTGRPTGEFRATPDA
jgi:hypothetical protein